MSKPVFPNGLMTLRPITSRLTGRYDKTDRVAPSHTTIAAGPVQTQPPYLPRDWYAFIHPEGQLYFHRVSALRIVTEAYLYNPVILARICVWAKYIEDLLSERGITFCDDVELFLKLDELDDTVDACSYYFVDHATRVQFWIEPVDTEYLELPPAVSTSHLRLALEELYWCHREFFPMHRSVTLSSINELISVFTHGRADQLTSMVSTFPYTASECANFLDLLKNCRDVADDGNTTCLVSRLWSFVTANRFTTHYGEETTRLSRDQAILSSPVADRHLMFKMCSQMMWQIPDAYLAKFNDVFVDELVYVDQWRQFMTSCVQDWRRLLPSTYVLLALHALLFLLPSLASRILALISASLASASILATLILDSRHHVLTSATATEAAMYLYSVRSTRFGFQRIATVFSLPRVLFFMSLGAFLSHWILMAYAVNSTLAAVALGVCGLTVCAVAGVPSPAPLVAWPWRALRAGLSSEKKASEVLEV